MRPVALRTARLVLDEPTLADADLVAQYCRDPLFERYLTTPWPYSRADAEAFLGEFVPESWASGTELTWAIRRASGGALLGMIGLCVGSAVGHGSRLLDGRRAPRRRAS